jgi:hypothetical protein
LAAEIAKCLKLVASATMNAEQQTVWLHSAVDALEGIRPSEVAAISAELRRSVTRPAQIVPEVARLVAERRKRGTRQTCEARTCGCGAGKAAGERLDVHWIERDGRQEIEWCAAPHRSL